MHQRNHGPIPFVLACLILVAVISAVAIWRAHAKHLAEHQASLQPASTQSNNIVGSSSTKPAPTPANDSYLAAIRSAYPDYPATQPLAMLLELSQAAHLVLHDPIYLGGGGRPDMWITRANASAIETVLREAVDSGQDVDVHVLHNRVAFVHWMPTENGLWPPYVVCSVPAGGYEVISADYGHQSLPSRRGYHWNHALSWNDKVVVPTELGVSIFHFGRQIEESYHGLSTGSPIKQRPIFSEPQLLLDWQGLLAWLPWEPGKTGGLGAARYVESVSDETTGAHAPGQWTDLTPENGWPAKILHLVPLLDGTVLMLTVGEQDAVHIQYNTLEHATVKEEVIDKLVADLSDNDETVRHAAYDKLSQYGSGIWPLLEKLMDDQGPEAQAHLRQLLKQKVVPTLNGMVLLGSKTLKLAARLADGGTVFYAQAGVSIPNIEDPDAAPDYRVPAWISIRPGHSIELLPEALTSDLTAGESTLYANGNDWIVTNDVRGPRRFVGNGFVNLLRKSEHEFSDFVGIDRRGRWVFRKPSSTATTTPAIADAPTLIIDPTLPDPIPRLPVWILNTADEVGWTKAGWPVTKKNSSYALHETGWQLVDEKDRVFQKPEEVPSPTEPTALAGSTTQPAKRSVSAVTEPAPSTPTTGPTAAQPTEVPILTGRDGTRYFGGLDDLRLIPVKGPPITWPLPEVATGKGPVWLVRTADGCLYLFNQPGRIVRIKPTPGRDAPFTLETIFTHHVPTVDHPTRIWLDPAGRIAMVWDNQLAIFFPTGYIPRPIGELMLSGDQDEDE